MEKEIIDFYKILEISKSADSKEIKKSYRDLARKYHPDVSKEENAKEKFQEIQEAYEVLGDEELRAEYDVALQNHEEMLERKRTKFSDVFHSFYKKEADRRHPIDGKNVHVTLMFTIKDSYEQTKKKFEYNRFRNCRDCRGYGFISKNKVKCEHCVGKGSKKKELITPFGTVTASEGCIKCDGTTYKDHETCQSCLGTGKEKNMETLQIEIPENVYHGKKMILSGWGELGIRGGEAGNLIITFEHDPTDGYKIEYDYDVVRRFSIPLKTALLGGDVRIAKPDGEEEVVKITKATPNGARLVIGNMGLLNEKKNERGIYYAEINVEMPTDLTQSNLNKIGDLL